MKIKFKMSRSAMRNGLIMYTCSLGIIPIGLVSVSRDGIFVLSKKANLIDEIKEAFDKECG